MKLYVFCQELLFVENAFWSKSRFLKNEGIEKTKIEMSCLTTKKNSNSTFCRADFALPADRVIKVPTFSFRIAIVKI